MKKIESEFEVVDPLGYQNRHETRNLKLKPGEKILAWSGNISVRLGLRQG